MGDNTADMDIGTFPADWKAARYGTDEADSFRQEGPKGQGWFDLVVKARHEGFHSWYSTALRMLAAEMADEGGGEAKKNAREGVDEI